MRDFIETVGVALSTEERCRRFKEEITAWVGDRRQGLTMSHHEVGAIKGSMRAVALFKAAAVNAITSCRLNPRESTRLGVLNLIALNCDNDRECCTLSIKRMAEVICRKEDNIRAAIKDLERDGLVGVARTTGGMLNRYWLIVPRTVVERDPHPTWIVDAFSPKPVRHVNVAQNGKPPRGRGVHLTPPEAGGYPPAEGVQYSTTLSAKDSRPDQAIWKSLSHDLNTTSQQLHGAETTAGPSSSPDNGGATLQLPEPKLVPTLDGANPADRVPVNPVRDNSLPDASKKEIGCAPCTDHAFVIQMTEEWRHKATDGRRPKAREIDPKWLPVLFDKCVKAWKRMGDDKLAENDTPIAILAMLPEMQRHGLKLPPGTPTLEELYRVAVLSAGYLADVEQKRQAIPAAKEAVKAAEAAFTDLLAQHSALEAEQNKLMRGDPEKYKAAWEVRRIFYSERVKPAQMALYAREHEVTLAWQAFEAVDPATKKRRREWEAIEAKRARSGFVDYAARPPKPSNRGWDV